MRRADRLFQIVQILRRRRLTTARHLAETLGISERTVYRDVRDLMASGVPIEGEAGVGYRLRGFELPPLMFSRDEVEALVLGARIVQSWTDPGLARAASEALAKIEAALPRDRSHLVQATPLFAPDDHWQEKLTVDFTLLREAVRDSRRLRFCYTDAHGTGSERIVRALALSFYGPVWVLASWCELRQDFRAFRLDRIQDLEVLPGTFPQEPGRTLQDFLAVVGAEDTHGLTRTSTD
ncbi:MAG TPA: YafY family protein [Thermoanaerobaculia bacterium]|nr:YafY family protein [Thermoanaerobaculia bacterium]